MKGLFSPGLLKFLFESKLKAYENILLVEEAMKGLTDVEVVFLKLAWFFEAPEQEGFNIGLFFHHLNNDWLEFTLELVTQFFLEDMFLIEKPPIPFF